MNYSTLSTRSLEKILGRSAADSAEERAVREELRQRASEAPKAIRRRMPVLFDAKVWKEMAHR